MRVSYYAFHQQQWDSGQKSFLNPQLGCTFPALGTSLVVTTAFAKTSSIWAASTIHVMRTKMSTKSWQLYLLKFKSTYINLCLLMSRDSQDDGPFQIKKYPSIMGTTLGRSHKGGPSHLCRCHYGWVFLCCPSFVVHLVHHLGYLLV